jgi:subtilisin-like proprotein convertase family protein/sugar lactone lactonase YvrE
VCRVQDPVRQAKEALRPASAGPLTAAPAAPAGGGAIPEIDQFFSISRGPCPVLTGVQQAISGAGRFPFRGPGGPAWPGSQGGSVGFLHKICVGPRAERPPLPSGAAVPGVRLRLPLEQGPRRMSLDVILRHLRGRWFGGSPRRGRRRPAGRTARRGSAPLPQVETLEDRTLLSVLPPPVVTQQAVLSINSSNLSGRIGTGGMHNTPAIAVDPANPQQMVAVYSTDLGAGLSVIQGSYSTDGGAHWQPITGPSEGFPQSGNPVPVIPDVLSQAITNPLLTDGSILPMATDPTVAFDHAVSVAADGSFVNRESFYVVYVEHTADNSAGAVMMEKFDFSAGVPQLSPLTPRVTVGNMQPGGGGFGFGTDWQQDGMLYSWAGATQADSDPALNPVVMVDSNLPPVFTDPKNPNGPKVSFVDPTTGATQADKLIVPLVDDNQYLDVNHTQPNPNYGKPILDPTTHNPIWQGEIYVAWNTNNALPAATPALTPTNSDFTPNNIRLMASSDGGQMFTTARFANQNDTGDPNTTLSHEYDAAPRLVVAQGTSSDRTTAGVQGGQVTIVWDNFGGGTLQSNSVQDGGTGAVFTDNNPQNSVGTGSVITDALPGANGGPDIPQSTLFTQNVNITNPNFVASDLSVSLDLTHLNLDQLNIVLYPEAKLSAAHDLAFGPDQMGNPFGNLYVTSPGNSSIVEYFGPSETNPGGLDGVFVASGAGGLSTPEGLAWGSDGSGGSALYVTGLYTKTTAQSSTTFPAVFRYHADGTPDPSNTGMGLDPSNPNSALFAALPSDIALSTFTGLAFDSAGNLYVGAYGNTVSDILEFQGAGTATEGQPVGSGIFVAGGPNNGLNQPYGLAWGTDDSGNKLADLYIGNFGGADVLRFNSRGAADPSLQPGVTGAEFIPASSKLLTQPTYLAFGADGNLYVSNSDPSPASSEVLRFLGPDNVTGPGFNPLPGTFLDVFAANGAGTSMTAPRGLAFQVNPVTGALLPRGNLFVLGQTGAGGTTEVDAVYQFTGVPGVPDPHPGLTGNTANFYNNNSGDPTGNLLNPHSLVFRPGSNDFLATDTATNRIQRYDATTGQWLGSYISPATGNGLLGPTGIAISPANGRVYVSSSSNSKLIEYSGVTSGTYVKTLFDSSGIPGFAAETPSGLTFDAGGDLFIADYTGNQILRYDNKDNPLPSGNFKAAQFAVSGTAGAPVFFHPTGLAFDNQAKVLYVSATDAFGNGEILTFDSSTGNFLGVFADKTGTGLAAGDKPSPLGTPGDLYFNPGDRTLYVSSQGGATLGDRILRYSVDRTPHYMESIVPYDNGLPPLPNNGGLSKPLGIALNINDGTIDVVSQGTYPASGVAAQVLRFTGTPASPVGPGGVFVQPGGGPEAVQLLLNHTNPGGSANTGIGITSGVNLGVWNDPKAFLDVGQAVGVTFDQHAARFINDANAKAPYSQHYKPETLGTDLSFVVGQGVAQLDSTWILQITDERNNTSGGVAPQQYLESWSLDVTSGLDLAGIDRTIPTPGAAPAAGSASEDGSTIFNNGWTSTTAFPNNTTALESPNRGVGPTPSIAIDNTLGSFSPYQGRIYVVYTSGSGTGTDIYLTTSDDGGQTWLRKPVKVNDDSAADNFSTGTRPQFDPSVAVDPLTGTLVITFYDARNDAALTRSALYVATSIDGGWSIDPTTQTIGADFAPETYLNDSLTATDAITYQTVNQGPIPDNPKADANFNFGDHQGLAVYQGHIYAAWSGDQNEPGVMNVYTTGATIAAGPRVVSSTEGAIQAEYATTDDGRTFAFNNTYAVDGTPQVNGFIVTFDRPVDVSTFTPSEVQVAYRDTATPAGIPPTLLPATSVIPLDGYTTRFGPALVGGLDPNNKDPNGNLLPYLATRFLVNFGPSAGVGTYSYSVGPDIADRIRSRVTTVGTGTALPPQTQTTTDTNPQGRIPPVDTGGDANNGAPQNDVTTSTITVSGVPTTERVLSVSVTVNLLHTSDRDLVLTLVAPDGTAVVLSQNEGGSGHNYQGTVFTDSATTPISQGTAPFTGQFKPEEPLGMFFGKVANGNWQLQIDDTLQNDIGTFQNWTLNITVGPEASNLVMGNQMDQNGNGTSDEAATATSGGDVYSVPTPVGNGPIFHPAYVSTSLPLIIPGPHIVSTFVPGADQSGNVINPQSNDNLVLNQAVHYIDVTFDRDMDPNSFTTGTGPSASSPGATPLFQLLGPNGAINLFDPTTGQPLPGVSIVPDPNPQYPRLIDGQMSSAPDPDLTHPRTFRITLPDLPGAPAGSGLNLDGTYELTIAPNLNTAVPGPASAAGDLIDTNQNAGLDLLRGVASDPLNAKFQNVSHAYIGGDVAIPAGKGPIDIPLSFGPEDFLIQKATVQLNISAPNDPALSAVLISPDGKTMIPLFTGVGNNGTHQNFSNTVFDDTASTPIQLGIAPFNSVQFGPFQPQEPLAQLNNLPSAGVWTLQVANSGTAGQDAVLHSWSLTLTEAVPGTGLGEQGADNATINFRVFTQDPNNPLSHTVWTPVGPAAITTAVTPATANVTNSAPVTHYSPTVPMNVGPGQTITETIDFRPENFPIQKVVPTVNISSPNDGDLTGVLIAPDGTQMTLFDRAGAGTADFANTSFDDLAQTSVQLDTYPATGPFYSPIQGSFVPRDPLSALLNKSSYGTWTLQITNHSTTDTATLNGWSLTLSEPIPSDSGQVNAIAVDPSDPSGNTVYIGAEGGGIWRTTDFLTTNPNGPTWTPLLDYGPTGSTVISSIAVFGRNNDPRQSIIFATTGNGGTNTPGVGILRSEDGGTTWTLLDSTNNTDSPNTASGNLTPINTPFNPATDTGRDHAFVGLTSYKILVDPTPAPTNPSDVVVYACMAGGANGGLWRSLDSGRHWSLMGADAGQTATGTNCTDVVFAPATVSVSSGNLQDVYAAFAGTGIYFSTNQGSNLRLISGGVGNTLIRDGDTGGGPIGVNTEPNPNGATGRIVLAVPPLAHDHINPATHKPDLQLNAQDPANLIYEQWLYAEVITPAGTLQGLYATKDTGANWTQVQLPALAVNGIPTGIPTNDETQPNHDPTGPAFQVPGGNGNTVASLMVDPANPSVVYMGGLDNVGIDNTPQPAGGLIRVDTTILEDAHNFTAQEYSDPDGGALNPVPFYAGDGSLLLKGPPLFNGRTYKLLKQEPDGSGNVNVITPLNNTPYVNLITDPNNPFLRNSTNLVSGVVAFSNDGDDASYQGFIQAVNGPHGFEENGNIGVEAMTSFIDPLTGLPRLLLGATTGIFTALDNNGNIVRSLGDTTDPSSTAGDVPMPNQSRNGNLQIAPLFDGTAQPSIPAAEIAAGIRGSGGLFYGNANNVGFPTSDPHLLDNGNLLWSGPLGSGSGVATDQTGTGNAYSFQWPGFGIYSSLALTNFFLVNPQGSGYISRTGTGGTSLVQVNGGDPQWPFMSVNPTVTVSQYGGASTPLNLPNSRFAVNPINGDQIVISSESGRIFRSRDQGRDWAPIADPTAANTPASGGYSPALAYGAPDPLDPNHQLDDFIYAGTTKGTMWVTLDGGSHWVNISNPSGPSTGPVLDGSPILSISTNPIRGSHEAYVVTERGIYHVTFNVSYPFNGAPVVSGVTWQNLTGNLFGIKSTFAGFYGQPDAVSGPTTLNATNGLLLQMPHDNSTANAGTYAPEESQLQFLTSLAVDWREVVGPTANPQGPTLYVGGAGGVFRLQNPNPTVTTGTKTWEVFPGVAQDGSQVTGGFMPMAQVTDLYLDTGGINPATGLPNQATGPNILMAATYGRGDFAIRLPNNNPFNPVDGPHIVSLSPTDAPSGTSSITVTFNESVDPATFTTASIDSFTGPDGKPIVPLSVTDVTPAVAGQPSAHDVFQITFAPVTLSGNYTIVIGPNVMDFSGHAMDQNGNGINGEPGPAPTGDEFVGIFTIHPVDQNGLHVTSAVADSLVSPPGMSEITVTFSLPVDATTFTTADVSLLNPANAQVGGVTVTDVNPGTDTVWNIQFPTQTAVGNYGLTLSNTIKDQNGHYIDQNENDPNPTTNILEPQDRFQQTFTVTQPPQPPGPPPPPVPAPPGVVTSVAYTVRKPRKLRNGRYLQLVTVYNVGSAPIQQPLALILGNLRRGIRLLNASGVSRLVSPGSPYVLQFLPNAVLNSFEGATFRLLYLNRKGKKISPAFELVAGILAP